VRCGACLAVFHGVEHLVLAALPDDGDEAQARQALDDLLDELAVDSTSPGAARPARVEHPPDGLPPAAVGTSRGPRQRPPLFAGFEDAPDDAGVEAEVVLPSPFEVAADSGGEAKGAASPEAAPEAAPEAPPTDEPAPDDAGAVAVPEPAARPAPGVAPHLAPPAFEPVMFGETSQRRPLVWLGIAAGVLLLAAQVLWYQFDDWAKQPHWRAVYVPLCTVLGCALPVQRDTAQLGTRNLVVRTHPEQARMLLVNAVIVNGAQFAQPFPALELQFTTVRGNLVASRRFDPDQYLAGDAAGMELIPPRTPVQIELSIADPGPDAVNYRLNFR
jgi:hypothetical protein